MRLRNDYEEVGDPVHEVGSIVRNPARIKSFPPLSESRRRYRGPMLTRPDDLDDDAVAAAVAEGWGVTVTEIEYAALGFGSHHWRVRSGRDRWFVNVDDLDARSWDASDTRAAATQRLTAALTLARSLRDTGLDFVVAPIRTRDRQLLRAANDRYVAALYEHVEGETYEWGTPSDRPERLAVLDRIVAIHEARIVGASAVDTFVLPQRETLDTALGETDRPWGPGPYEERARALVHDHRAALTQALARYDRLVDDVANRGAALVPTHGEPHRGNRIKTLDGVVLIDWDTALLAPPERDLWMLIDEEPQIATDYRERTGVAPDDSALALYRLRWDLCEICLFVADFRAPHGDTEDNRLAWTALSRVLDPSRWDGPG